MINSDLFTHPQADVFAVAFPKEEKMKMAEEWKSYLEEEKIWISFYSWKKKMESDVVLMADSVASSSQSWTAPDGSRIETSTTYPPFKSIVLGEGQSSAHAYPLVQRDNAAMGTEGRIQKVSEQVNWTNTTLTGLEKNVAKTALVKDQIDSVQVSVNDLHRV